MMPPFAFRNAAVFFAMSPLVERVGPLRRDRAQRPRQIRDCVMTSPIASGLPSPEPDLRATTGYFASLALPLFEAVRERLGDREAAVGDLDRRRAGPRASGLVP